MKHELGLEIKLTEVIEERLTRIARDFGPNYRGIADKTSIRSFVVPLWQVLMEGPNEV